jgi:hypothetical protein
MYDIVSLLNEFNFQDSNEIHFRVKMTTQMGKLKKSYSERVVSYESPLIMGILILFLKLILNF